MNPQPAERRDGAVLDHINAMVDEEHRLRREISAGAGAEPRRARLRQLEVELDRCWDLLRQRRAKVEFGKDPEAARERPASEVEGYLS